MVFFVLFSGAGGRLEVIHSDGDITQVIHDDSYDFNCPAVHHLQSPVTVNPGNLRHGSFACTNLLSLSIKVAFVCL